MKGIEDEENYYADFVKQQVVKMLPQFAGSFGPAEAEYQFALGQQDVCKRNLGALKTVYKDEEQPK
ncbi:MHC class II antigen alpha chain, partial [Clarias magur]